MHKIKRRTIAALSSVLFVVGITRGGLVPACIIARELDIKMVETLCISSYDHQDQRKAQVLKEASNIGTGEGWLIIDDLVDTGNTFVIARELYPDAHYHRRRCIMFLPF